MSNKDKFLIAFMLIFLVLIVISENKQRQINWYPSYSVNHKIPFGSYVFHNEAKKLFKEKLHDSHVTPYVFLNRNPEANGNFIFYNAYINFGKTNLKKLLNWVKKGNNVFIFSNGFGENLKDTLQIKEKYFYNSDINNRLIFRFTNPLLQYRDTTKYNFRITGINYFKMKKVRHYHRPFGLSRFVVDTDTTLEKTYTDSLYNFIRIKFGKGHFFLHSFPKVVTNHFILKDNNYKYMEGLFSYMNNGKDIYWDTSMQNGSKTKGMFSVLIANPSFLWAYRLLFIGLLFYIIFEGKRKQRPIPIVEPPKNETVSFAKTIAEMYMENKEHEEMVALRIKLFSDWIRNNLHLNINKLDNELMQKISDKTKTDIKDVKNVFEMIAYLENVQEIRARDVLKLENLINKITKK